MGAPPAEDNVAARLKGVVEKMVGHKAVDGGKDKGGIDCFALVDQVLKSVGAKTASDFGEVTPTADYVWGKEVDLDAIQPGDILQFREHTVMITTQKLGPLTWRVTSTEGPATRTHHSAIVVGIIEDGSVEVVEQKVKPTPKTIRRDIIARLAKGQETRYLSNVEKVIIEVTGRVTAYRPVAKPKGTTPRDQAQPIGKPKGGSLFPHDGSQKLGGRQMLARYQPTEGGPKRPSGPLRNV
jgi:hypothetical protein